MQDVEPPNTLKTGTPVEDGDPISKLLRGVGIHSELHPRKETIVFIVN